MFCYCDLADAATCVAQGAHGACAPEFEAAAGTKDVATIISMLQRPFSTTTAVGVALGHHYCAVYYCSGYPTSPCPWWPQLIPRVGCGNSSVDKTDAEECDPPRSSPRCDLSCRLAPLPDPPTVCANPLPGVAWTIDPPPSNVTGATVPMKLFSIGPDDTWLWYTTDPSRSSGNRHRHWDGSVWTEMAPPWDSLKMPDALWASGPKDIWYGVLFPNEGIWGRPGADNQKGALLRWDGSKTTKMLSFAVSSIWGTGPNDVWVIDERQRALHWNGSTWSVLSPASGAGPVRQIRGSAPDDLWGFDSNAPGLSHWDGTRWTFASSADPDLQATKVQSIWAVAANDIWLLGKRCSGSQLWHYDGARWSFSRNVTIASTSKAGLWGSAGNDVWLWVLSDHPPEKSWAGSYQNTATNGRLEHFDGASWSVVDVGALSINSFSGEGTGRLWASGEVSVASPTTKLFHLHAKCGDTAP